MLGCHHLEMAGYEFRFAQMYRVKYGSRLSHWPQRFSASVVALLGPRNCRRNAGKKSRAKVVSPAGRATAHKGSGPTPARDKPKVMRKRRTHYVSQFYLRPWADGERVYCLRRGHIRAIGLKDVAIERDFYQVRDLQPDDIQVLRRGVIEPSEAWAKPLHEHLLEIFARVAAFNRCLAQRPDVSNELRKAQAELISNLDEDYHSSIEHDLQIGLKSLLVGSTDFFSDVRIAGGFLRALALQSLRTKKRRQMMCGLVRIPIPGAAMERMWGPMIHMLAVNIGGSLLRDRHLFRIILLKNETQLPFITGDQPVININDDRDPRGIPSEIEFYYPLSPKSAMWFVLTSKAPKPRTLDLTEEEVRSYNARIANNHHEQLYANEEKALIEWVGFQ